MITKELLKSYAEKLLFRMNEEEYDTLLKEFDIILKQMDLIGKMEGIAELPVVAYPFINEDVQAREDMAGLALLTEEVLSNAKKTLNNQVKVPKVVE